LFVSQFLLDRLNGWCGPDSRRREVASTYGDYGLGHALLHGAPNVVSQHSFKRVFLEDGVWHLQLCYEHANMT